MQRLKDKLYQIIFDSDTFLGKVFDILLLLAIFSSVIVVALDSVREIRAEHHSLLIGLEWGFTILFTLEYLVRIFCVRHPMKYIFSFYGLVDLLSILPTYISLFADGYQSLAVVRELRVLRLFRIFKLMQFVGQQQELAMALKQSRYKIGVFLITVLSLDLLIGAAMYLIEGEANGFTSIPKSMYWAIVTITTVGYGDIAPSTVLGQGLAAFVMILGYSVIAVPTGVVSVELTKTLGNENKNTYCDGCGLKGHQKDARCCRRCGKRLEGRE